MNTKSHKQFRKFLYGIILTGMILSLGFGMGGLPTVLAQEAVTVPYQIFLPLVFRDFAGTPPPTKR